MNPELANRLRRFGETVDHAAIAAQSGRAAPGEPAATPLVETDDTDELPTVVPINARKASRYRVVTAAAAAIIVVVAGGLIATRITGETDPGPAASTDVVAINTTGGPSSTTSTTSTSTTVAPTTAPLIPPGPTSTSTSSSTTTTAGSGSSSGTTPAATTPRICPNGYNPYDNRYPIQLCDEGPAVELIQLHVGAPDSDGEFGPATRQSVRVFQELNNLEVDGLVGRNTWMAMFPDGAPGTDTDGSGIVDPWEVS